MFIYCIIKILSLSLVPWKNILKFKNYFSLSPFRKFWNWLNITRYNSCLFGMKFISCLFLRKMENISVSKNWKLSHFKYFQSLKINNLYNYICFSIWYILLLQNSRMMKMQVAWPPSRTNWKLIFFFATDLDPVPRLYHINLLRYHMNLIGVI